MTIPNKGRTIFTVIAAIACLAYSLVSLSKGEFWRALFWGLVSLYMIRTAKNAYREEWNIEKHGQIFTIRRNAKILFKGPSSNIAQISSSSCGFSIHTLQEQRIDVPKELQSDELFQLILSEHQMSHETSR